METCDEPNVNVVSSAVILLRCLSFDRGSTLMHLPTVPGTLGSLLSLSQVKIELFLNVIQSAIWQTSRA